MKFEKKLKLAQRRKQRVRKNVIGTAEKPRLSVCFTNLNIHAQVIDDSCGKTLVAASSLCKETKVLPNVEGSTSLGSSFGEKIKAAGITQIVFDRGSRRYHGCVKAFADAVRKAGIKF